MFTVPASLRLGDTPLGNFTLLQGLNFQGGNSTSGKAEILLRAAIAAYLNSLHPAFQYPLTPAQVVAQTNAALASGNKMAITALAQTLDMYNNLRLSLELTRRGQTTLTRAPSGRPQSLRPRSPRTLR